LSTPANSIFAAVGAAPYATGAQVWKGHIEAQTPKPNIKAPKIHIWTWSGRGWAAV
jgi:hypothetical protein